MENMRTELLESKTFMLHSVRVIGKVTPYIPLVSLFVGSAVVCKYVVDGLIEARKATNPQTTTKNKTEDL